MIRHLLLVFVSFAPLSQAEPLTLRVVAANLTSDNRQTYSPDNGNHSNPEGAGARILTALKPDIVCIQEFNTSIPTRRWVNSTFGKEFHFFREGTKGIPNGIISRYPIIESGLWDDPMLENREFAWARIRLPENREVWVASVHFHSKGADSRSKESAALLASLREHVPKDAMIVLGGDLNTRTTEEPCFRILKRAFVIPRQPPHDQNGIIFTNSPRNRPYDWVLASKPLDQLSTPVIVAEQEFPHGLVFDTRVFTPMEKLSPARKSDSAHKMMQHMAVIRDFRFP